MPQSRMSVGKGGETIKSDEADKLYTVEEVQYILAIGRTKAYEIISIKKSLPSIRIGRCVRVRKEDLDRFIAENEA